MLRTSILLVCIMGLLGCADSRNIDQRITDSIGACRRSENCSLLDSSGNRQIISRPISDADRPAALCGRSAKVIEVSHFESDHSSIFRGRCEVNGKKVAQITLWYFPDSRYDLTIEDCLSTGCKSGWYSPI